MGASIASASVAWRGIRRTATGRPIRQVRYSPYPSQWRFHTSAARFKGLSGPVGTGKSRAVCQEALKLSYINSGCVGVIAAPTYRMLHDVTRLTFVEILIENGVPHQFHRSEDAIELREPRSLVRFRSMELPERLIGPNLAWFGVDELSYCEEDGWKRLEARLRDRRAKHLCGFGCWTPNGFNWTWRRFISPDRIAGYEAVVAQPGENRAVLDIVPDYYDRLKQSYDDRFYRQEVLGEYVEMFSGAVYSSFSEENLQPVVYRPDLPLLLACDFNIDPMCWIVAQMDREPQRGEVRSLRVLFEIVLSSATTEEAVDVFIDRTEQWAQWNRKLQVLLYGDSSGHSNSTKTTESDYEIIAKRFRRDNRYEVQFRVGSDNPPIKERVNAVNAMLKNAAGERRLLIDPSCKELRTDLLEVRWKTDLHGSMTFALDKTNWKRTHTSDALGYLVHKECGLHRSGGYQRETLF